LKKDNISQLLEKLPQRDFRDLARTLTILDQWQFSFSDISPLFEHKVPPSLRLGITGPPGAGKSTIINEIIRYYRSQKMSVGVLAVDPSSPFSKGAVLGDRIRYSEFFNDPGVYIRSLGSRGSLGGLSAAAYLMLRAYDLYQFDIVLIETVGVGQTELDIMNVADLLSVVLVPESGDSIQAMKAGLLEITQMFIVNKADRPGSEAFANELKNTLNLISNETEHCRIFLTEAHHNKGIQEFCEYIQDQKKSINLKELRAEPKKLKYETLAILKHYQESNLLKEIQHISSSNDVVPFFNKYFNSVN
jgi:LAO/AO transport system kinase